MDPLTAYFYRDTDLLHRNNKKKKVDTSEVAGENAMKLLQ
jgi:hypothetical protein